MKLSRINFEQVATTDLSDDDRFVLNVIYQSRLRTWGTVFFIIIGYLTLRALPYLFNEDPLTISGAAVTVAVIGIIPAAIYFWKGVWAYRRDLRSGFKYVVYEEVIRKQYFPYTDQYFLSLADANYMHHEVEQSVYEAVNIGDRYPVYFAAVSRYPFTLRARITAM